MIEAEKTNAANLMNKTRDLGLFLNKINQIMLKLRHEIKPKLFRRLNNVVRKFQYFTGNITK
jgi:hypothetical protein